jgi:hypothetical protein
MTDEMMPVEPSVTASMSQHGRVCTMSLRMAESVSQWGFYVNQGMHYMASQATAGDTDEDLFNDAHLNSLTAKSVLVGEKLVDTYSIST